MLALLRAQRRGESYLGHVGRRHDFLVLFADRGTVSNTETLQRLEINPATLPLAHLPPTASSPAALQAIHAAIEAQEDLPAAVFVEGADLLVEDASKTSFVTSFVTGLRALAEHYAIAVVLSVGSPKARPKEQYIFKRDQVFGSQAWSRLADTVCVLSVTADGTEATRDLVVLHRNAAAEKFHLAFVNGHLVPTERSVPTDQDRVTWFRDVEVFTKQRFRNAFPQVSGNRATELLDGYVAIGTLREKRRQDRTYYVYRPPKPSDTSETDSDDFGTAVRTPGSVRGQGSDGPGFPTTTAENANVFDATNGSLEYPQNSVLLSEKDSLPSLSRTFGHTDRGIRARARPAGDEAVPAWVTEPGGPDFSDPIGRHDEDVEQ
jgi:hypothetical protein